MNEKLKQIIKEEILNLPKEGQDAIGSIDWIKITEEIGNKYLLIEEEIDNLQLETLLVLIGVTDKEFYAINIENQIGATKETAQKIAEEVVNRVFIPIYKKLEENVRAGLANKKITWDQNVDFIISGGNYLSFLAETENETENRTMPVIDLTEKLVPKPQPIKITTKDTSKTTGIKSKFVI